MSGGGFEGWALGYPTPPGSFWRMSALIRTIKLQFSPSWNVTANIILIGLIVSLQQTTGGKRKGGGDFILDNEGYASL